MKRREILGIIETAVRKKAATLNLRGKEIAILPPDIGRLTALTELQIEPEIK